MWEHGDGSKLPSDLISRIEIILEVIDSANKVPQDFEAYRNWNIHKLTGDRKDFWSIKVNKNYRIVFIFDGRYATDIDYIDYH